MSSEREFRKLTFTRKLDVRRVRAALSQTMAEVMKSPSPDAAPVRSESIFIEPDKTTVFISGNRPGLDGVAKALRKTFPDANISKASRDDVLRVLNPQGSKG